MPDPNILDNIPIPHELRVDRKSCFIEYSATAQEVTVEVCRDTLVKDCGVEGPEVRLIYSQNNFILKYLREQ